MVSFKNVSPIFVIWGKSGAHLYVGIFAPFESNETHTLSKRMYLIPTLLGPSLFLTT